ncbi:MAG: TMEM175 family protein [Streptococcaceae bacterium]|jgi:uncharacterized membrane protein|nr:TMEM175 family protein [Streptococcaceae bacterium]
MTKERLNAITDAVFAIIATIMVLEFKVPSHPTWAALTEALQPMLAYIISFFIIWVSWYSTHQLTKPMVRITYRYYWLAGISLVVMSFMPFTTAWVGQNFMAFVPEIFYAIINLISFVIYHLLMEPEALRNTPVDKRPPVHNNILVNRVRIIAMVIGLVTVYWFPPISVLVLLTFSSLHIIEHIGIEKSVMAD